MQKRKILFIDDDKTLQILAAAMMNSGVFDVVSAQRTAHADEILCHQKIDIIVCDVMMPEEDGLKFCRRLRDNGNRTPILMLSAVSDPRVIQEATAIGATDYLVKPFDIHALQKKLLAMLGASATADAHRSAPPKSEGFFGWLRR